MQNRSSTPGKVKADVNQNAFRTLQEAIGEKEKTSEPSKAKDPLAVELGRRGGLKGGKARAASMTPAKRKAIAKKAAKARWG